MQARTLHFRVGHFDDGDREVAGYKGEEDGQDHLRDAPLVAL